LPKLPKRWVSAVEDELTRADGTIALQPSRLRHGGKVTQMLFDWLSEAKARGEQDFNFTARHISDLITVPVREVYTLFYSP
jgi:hypothetical protein